MEGITFAVTSTLVCGNAAKFSKFFADARVVEPALLLSSALTPCIESAEFLVFALTVSFLHVKIRFCFLGIRNL